MASPSGPCPVRPHLIDAGRTFRLKSLSGARSGRDFGAPSTPKANRTATRSSPTFLALASDDFRKSFRCRDGGYSPTSFPTMNLEAARQKSGAVAPGEGSAGENDCPLAWISRIFSRVDWVEEPGPGVAIRGPPEDD